MHINRKVVLTEMRIFVYCMMIRIRKCEMRDIMLITHQTDTFSNCWDLNLIELIFQRARDANWCDLLTRIISNLTESHVCSHSVKLHWICIIFASKNDTQNKEDLFECAVRIFEFVDNFVINAVQLINVINKINKIALIRGWINAN